MAILTGFSPGFVADGGSDPQDVCDTLGQMLGRSNTLWNLSALKRPIQILCEGDSLGVQLAGDNHRSPLWWAMAIYWLDIRRGPTLARGTSFSGTSRGGEANTAEYGMTSEPRLANAASAYAQSIAAGYDPVDLVWVGTNDNYTTDNGQNGGESTVANVEKRFLRGRAAGSRHMILMGPPPSAAGGPTTLSKRGINLAFRALADKYRGQITFVDCSTVMAAYNTDYKALGGQGVYGATMYDTSGENAGLHPSAFGAYLIGKYALGPALATLVNKRTPLLGFLGDRYDGTLNSRGPLMGNQTRYAGATLPTSFVSGTQAVTQQDVADPMATLFGRSDVMGREAAFTGTPSADWAMSTQRNANDGGFDSLTTTFMPEAWVYVDMTNVKCPQYGYSSGGVGGEYNGGRDCDVIPRLKELLCLYASNPIQENNDFGIRTASLKIGGIANKETTGRVVFISASEYPQPALPTASA